MEGMFVEEELVAEVPEEILVGATTTPDFRGLETMRWEGRVALLDRVRIGNKVTTAMATSIRTIKTSTSMEDMLAPLSSENSTLVLTTVMIVDRIRIEAEVVSMADKWEPWWWWPGLSWSLWRWTGGFPYHPTCWSWCCRDTHQRWRDDHGKSFAAGAGGGRGSSHGDCFRTYACCSTAQNNMGTKAGGQGEEVAAVAKKGKKTEKVKCFRCGFSGHMS